MKRVNMYCRLLAFICFALVVLTGSTSAWSADLVLNGAPVGELVIRADAPKAEVFATTDVCHWIEEITGAKVPILNTPSSASNTKVFIGSSFAAAFRNDLKALEGNDGFAIRRQGNNIYVFGSRPRGTMYGVFALLESNSDIIWARPNEEFGTVFGRTDTLVLAHTDTLDIPVFGKRTMDGGHPPHLPTTQWQMRTRNNEVGRINDLSMDMIHGTLAYMAFPIVHMFKEHPEYFGYSQLTKSRKFSGQWGEGPMCLTSPGLPDVWAKELLRVIDEREASSQSKIEIFKLSVGDNWACCDCEECTKPITLPDGTKLVMKDMDPRKDSLFRSTQLYMFLNDAMKTLAKERPDVQFSMLAYIFPAEPPRVKLDPNLTIQFAPYDTSNQAYSLMDPRQNPIWRERFEKWLTMTDTLGFYEYWICKPEPRAFAIAENLRALLKTANYKNAFLYAEFNSDQPGTGSKYGASQLGWDIGAMNNWVVNRLLWNPNQDVDSLYRYYIQRTYREAAPQMTKYYELIKEIWLDPENKNTDYPEAGYASVYRSMIIDRHHEANVFSILDEAQAAATTPNSRILIERMRARFAALSSDFVRLMVASVPDGTLDGSSFDSPLWNKAAPLNDFKVTTRHSQDTPASQLTQIRATHDSKNLYVHFLAADTDPASHLPSKAEGDKEQWPGGEHIEFWLQDNRDVYVFAFDPAGNQYDAKNYDRAWNSSWRMTVRKTSKAYEAIATIPLAALGLVPGTDTKLTWFCTREITHGKQGTEKISYRGDPLYHVFYPIWWSGEQNGGGAK